MAAGRRNDPDEYKNAGADEPESGGLSGPPVSGETDPRVTARTGGRDQRAATATPGTPAPEPTEADEPSVDPDAAPDEQGPQEMKCKAWAELRVPADDNDPQGKPALRITDQWTRIEAADVSRVLTAARRARLEMRTRDPQPTDA